jgi:hypothetical protein
MLCGIFLFKLFIDKTCALSSAFDYWFCFRRGEEEKFLTYIQNFLTIDYTRLNRVILTKRVQPRVFLHAKKSGTLQCSYIYITEEQSGLLIEVIEN